MLCIGFKSYAVGFSKVFLAFVATLSKVRESVTCSQNCLNPPHALFLSKAEGLWSSGSCFCVQVYILFWNLLLLAMDVCPLLKALGKHVDVCNLNVLDNCFIDNQTISSFPLSKMFNTIEIKRLRV